MKSNFTQPFVLLMYGLPGAGKSAFARQFSAAAKIAHIHADRIRYELYDDASFSTSENKTVLRLAMYMAEELLKTGQSLVFDMHLPTQTLRDELRRLAAQYNARLVLVWVQTDQETAFYRASHRDRRRPDDKYSFNLSQAQFEQIKNGVSGNFKPNEKPLVISGKHLFRLQLNAIWRRFGEAELLQRRMPGTNSSSGRVDYERRALPRTPGF